jgi:hypothetical protein
MKTDVEKHVCAIFYAPVINQSMHVACHATTKRFVGFFFILSLEDDCSMKRTCQLIMKIIQLADEIY